MFASVVPQAVEGTIVTGSIYGLVGVAFALVFRSSKVLSFALGGFVLLGAFIFHDLVEGGWWYLPAVGVTVLAVSLLSGLLYVLLFARIAAREHFTTSVSTIGLAGVLTAVVAIRYGGAPQSLPGDLISGHAYDVFGAVVPVVDIVVVAAAAVIVAALVLILKYTPLGLRMEAVADNVPLAAHLGVSAARVAAVAWTLAGGATAVAGISYALRFSVDPAGVSFIGFLVFPAIILGGLDSIGGAMFGGIIVAGLQNAVQLTLGGHWVNIVSFALMLVVLYIKPTGLFGKAEAVRL